MTTRRFSGHRRSRPLLLAATWLGSAAVLVAAAGAAPQEQKKSTADQDGQVQTNPVPGMKPPKIRTIRRGGVPVDENKGPRNFAFDPPKLDLGLVPVGEKVRGAFTLRNISDEPLTIIAMKPDCKCTTLEDLTGTEIPPGGSVSLTTIVESRPYPGRRTSRIRFVFSNYGATQYEIVSDAARAVQTMPDHLAPEQTMWGEMVVRARDDHPFRILGVHGEPPTFLDGFEPSADEPRTSYKIRWDLSRYDREACVDADGNVMPRWYVIETDHPADPIVDVRVQHLCARVEYPQPRQNWVLSQDRVVLGRLKAGEPAEFDIAMNWFRKTEPDDIIHTVLSESPARFTAELLEVNQDEDGALEWHVRVTPMPGQHGLLYGRLRFYAERADYGLTVIGRIE